MLDKKLEKIVNQEVISYSLFFSFNDTTELYIKKDIKKYNLNKKEATKVTMQIAYNLCKNFSLEFNNTDKFFIFYPVDHLKIFLNNAHLAGSIDEKIEKYKQYYNIDWLNNSDRVYALEFGYKEDYSLPF